jgi:hypothetical protein
MSENLEPLSPREAAELVTGQRLNRDEAHEREQPSDDLLAGRRGVEASQGWSEMRMADPVSKETDEPIDSSQLLRRDEEAQPLPIQYLHQGGSKAGQPMPDNQTVSAEQASHDLTNYWQAVAESQEAELNAEIARAMKEVLGEQQQVTEAPPEAAQPEVNQGDDEVAKALQNPKILAAVEQYVQQHAAGAEQARLQYQSAMAQNALAAATSLFVSYPELQGVRGDQIPAAISVLQKTNPQRAEAMVRHIRDVNDLIGQHQQAQAAEYQAQQVRGRQQFDQTAKNADADWQAWADTQDGPERIKEISAHAQTMLRDAGMTEADINYHWNNNPLFRSAASQRILYQAAKYEMMQQAAREKVVRTAPKVQRPGSPLDIAPQADFDYRRLSDKLDRSTGRDALRAAADLVVARRNRRR